jgi:hypothetical protein
LPAVDDPVRVIYKILIFKTKDTYLAEVVWIPLEATRKQNFYLLGVSVYMTLNYLFSSSPNKRDSWHFHCTRYLHLNIHDNYDSIVDKVKQIFHL